MPLSAFGGPERLVIPYSVVVPPTPQDMESGIEPGLVRLSVGLEDQDDLTEDLSRASKTLSYVAFCLFISRVVP